MASQVYIDKGKFDKLTASILANHAFETHELNEYLKSFPYLTNRSRNKRGGEKYKEFDFDNKGKELRSIVLSHIKIK